MIRRIALYLILLLFSVASAKGQCTFSVLFNATPSCPGKNSGQIKLTMGSGSPTFKVYVNNETTPRVSTTTYTAILANLPAATYQVRIVDSQGCSRTFTAITIATATLASIKVDAPDVACTGTPFEVAAVLSGTTTMPYSYAWNNGKTAQSFSTSITTATSYLVTATDGNGCQIISPTVRVQPAAPPTLKMPASIQSCKGETVTLSAVVSDGTPGYFYLWSTGSKTSTTQVSPSTNTYYYLTVSDIKGCQALGSTLVSPTKTLSVTLPTGLETCENTSISLTPTVGANAGSLSYAWSTGAKTSSIVVPGDATKTFTVTVGDAAGCTGSASTSVVVNIPPAINFRDQYTVCKGSSVTLNPNLETSKAPYIYRWSTGANTATLTLTPTATQTVSLTITDVKKCTRQKSAEIQVASNPSVSLPSIITACSNTQTLVTPTVSAGTTPYFYKWSTGETDAALKHLFAKDEALSLEVKDQNGCVGTASASVKVYYPPVATLPTTTESCPGQSVSLEPVVNGNAPFTYSWSNGGTTSSVQVSPKTATTYSVTITDKPGCSSRVETLVSASKSLTVSLPSTQSVCERSPVTLTPQVGGASGTLKYAWSTGYSSASLTEQVLQNKTYSLTVYDAVGCTGLGSSSVTVLVPPVINLPDVQQICPGASIILNPTLDLLTAPYTYAWSNGEKTATLTLHPSVNTVMGLTITDKNKCTREKSVEIQLLSAPSILLPTTVAACSNQARSITATASGGTPNYAFSWSTGTTGSELKKVFEKNETVQVVVLDAKGCKDSAAVEVQVSYPPVVVFGSRTESCSGQSVVLSPSVSGGTGGYSFLWSTGSKETSIQVAPTTTSIYSLTVTDTKNCSGIGQTTVSTSGKLAVELPASLGVCEQGTITATPMVSGATGKLTYSWSTGSSGATLSTVVTATTSVFSVTVTDDSGCRGVASMAVEIYPTPVINLPDDVSTCPGGVVTLDPRLNPANAPYTYGWSTGVVSAILTVYPTSDLTVGLTVTDKHQCSQSKQVSVHIAPAPEVDLPASMSVCSNAEATVKATLVGGFPESYLVTWSTGDTGKIVQHLFEKDEVLWVLVADAGGCMDSDTVRIQAQAPPIVRLPDTLQSCPGEQVTLSPIVTGGAGGYSYAWNTGSTSVPLEVAPLSPTNYSLQVTDALGCQSEAVTWISASSTLAVSLPQDWSGCEGTSIALTPGISAHTGGLSYAWSTGATTTTLTMQATTSTTVSVQVTDSKGCKGIADTRLTVYPLPVLHLPASVSVCLGGTLELNPSLTGTAYTYAWSTGATTSVLQIQPVTNTEVQLTVTDIHQCAQSAIVAVAIGPGPQIQLPDTIHACLGTIATINPGISGGQPDYAFLWSDGSIGRALSKQVTAATTVWLRIRDAAGCLDSASIQLVGDTSPTFELPDSVRVCKGNMLPLSLENLNGKAPLTISWSTGEAVSAIQWKSGDEDTIIRVSVADGAGCVTFDSVQVDIMRITGVQLVQDTFVCAGNTVRLQLTGADQLTIRWNTGAQAAMVDVQPSQTQTFEVWYQDERGCRDSLKSQVVVYSLPDVNLANQVSVCQGDRLVLEPMVVSGDALSLHFQWQDGVTTLQRTIQPPYLNSYALSITDTQGCVRRLEASVKVSTLPSVGLPDTLRICSGATFSLTPDMQGGGVPASITWSGGQQGTIYSGTAVDSMAIYCTVRDTNGCTGTDSTYLASLPTPAIALPERVDACRGEKVRFVPLSTGGDSYIKWGTGAIAPFLEILAQENGVYQAVITSSEGCMDTASVALDVHDLPVVEIAGSTGICAGETDTLQALVVGGESPFVYSWSTGSTEHFTPISSKSGVVGVVVEIKDSFGCNDLDTLQVAFLDAPAIVLDAIPAVCSGEKGYLAPLVTGGARPYQYQWNTGDTSSVLSAPSGTYTLSVRDAAGCGASVEVAVPVQQGPEVTVVALTRPGCNKYDGMVELSVRTQSPPALVQWSDGTIGTRIERVFPGVYQVAVSDNSPCVEELEFQLPCNCLASAGTMDPVALTLCKYEEKKVGYSVQEEVIPAGYKRWFVLHNSPGNVLGNTILSVDTTDKVRIVPGVLTGKTYYFSAVIAPVISGEKPDLGDPCVAVSPGTPIVFRPTPEKPATLEVADTLVCPGSSILISTNRQETGFMYVWQTPKGTFTTGTPVFTVANFGKADEGGYQVSVESEGCTSPWLGPLNLGISKDLDEIFTEPDKVVCGVDSTRIQANAPIGALGKWLSSSPVHILEAEKETTVVQDLVPGSNLFLWTVITHNCIIQDSLEVYYTPKPELHDDTVALDDEKNAALFNMLQNDSLHDIPSRFLEIQLLSQPAVGAVKLDSSGSITYIRDNSIGEDQELTFVYQVCNTDPTGNCPNPCDEAAVILNVAYNPRTLAFPALGLRPGSANPVWQFEAARPMFSASLTILDRWGQVVYREKYEEIQKGELVKAWNGLRGNAPVPPGAYYFTLEGTIENNEKIVQNGILYLLD